MNQFIRVDRNIKPILGARYFLALGLVLVRCRGVITASTSSGELSCGAIGDQDIGVINLDEGTRDLPRFEIGRASCRERVYVLV